LQPRASKLIALAVLSPIALSACYEVTFPVRESFVVDIPEFEVEELSESPDGWAFEETSPVHDTDKLMAQLPDGAQSYADLRLIDVMITSPEQGNLGEWLTDISLYVSTDDVLSPDDDLIVQLPELPPEQVQFLVPFPEGTTLQKYVEAGTLAVITTGTLIALPSETVAITIDVNAEGIVDPI